MSNTLNRYKVSHLTTEALLTKHLGKDPDAWLRDTITDAIHTKGLEWVRSEVAIAERNYEAEFEEDQPELTNFN